MGSEHRIRAVLGTSVKSNSEQIPSASVAVNNTSSVLPFVMVSEVSV